MALRCPQQGFVLITGLIFLVVITLLALTSMKTTILQERLASNLREQSRATEASDAALRRGEALVAAFTRYPQSGRNYTAGSTPSRPNNKDALTWHLWQQGQVTAAANAKAFLAQDLWQDDARNGNDPVPDAMPGRFDQTLHSRPGYFVEEMQGFKPRNLSPDARAKAHGQVLYRITARAEGGKPAAIAVTQSLYMKRY